ncbi:MAG: hypothetical protein KDE27_12755 [Planctomycetes bacterium]|nr:hypothetical protein [Planctomycetota bacterium]
MLRVPGVAFVLPFIVMLPAQTDWLVHDDFQGMSGRPVTGVDTPVASP